ncbi:MAG: hypothetical protein RLZZ609_2360 [Cyanobacteriota bacterium]|jgi:hypothetical protein
MLALVMACKHQRRCQLCSTEPEELAVHPAHTSATLRNASPTRSISNSCSSSERP